MELSGQDQRQATDGDRDYELDAEQELLDDAKVKRYSE